MRRIDIIEAHTVLEWDYNRNGWLPDRPSNFRRKEATAVQIHRMGIALRRDLGGFDSLTRDGKLAYVANVLKLWLPVSSQQHAEWSQHLGADTVLKLIAEYGPPALQPALTGS